MTTPITVSPADATVGKQHRQARDSSRLKNVMCFALFKIRNASLECKLRYKYGCPECRHSYRQKESKGI